MFPSLIQEKYREGLDQLFVTKLKQFTTGRPGKQ